MRGRKELFLLFLVLVWLGWLAQRGYPQENMCSPPKVLVRGEIVDRDDFVKHLQSQYPHQPVESVLEQIRSTVLAELRENSPGIELVDEEAQAEYVFSYTLSLIAAGEDIEAGGVLEGEYVAFFMSSKLVQRDPCGISGGVLKTAVIQDEPDVFRTIERNIDRYGSLAGLIEEFEKTHRVPPRGPKMVFALTREYVSPEPDQRKMDIRVRVLNCLGEPVFDRHHGQVVILPRRTARGELEPTKGFPQDFVVTENQIWLRLTREEGGSVTYTLQEGMDLDFDDFQVKTCGIDKVLVMEIMPPVPIAGVVMELEPEEVYIHPGDSTAIEGRLFVLTPLGKRVPLVGEVVDVHAEGLVDGSLEPQGKVKTDGEGKIRLTYKAGYKEEGITVFARYQPEGYPDEVKERTSVSLVEEPRCWRGKVDIVIDFGHRGIEKGNPEECGRREAESEMERHVHVWGEMILRPGEPEEIIAQYFSGTQIMRIRTFDESCVTLCRQKGVKGEVPVRPGSWEKTETTLRATLHDKKFRVFANLVLLDRKTGKYRFSCGFAGLVWKGFVENYGQYYNACTGETREERTASQEVEFERFDFSSGELEGQTLTLDKIHGERVVEYIPHLGGTVKYAWDFERIPCVQKEE